MEEEILAIPDISAEFRTFEELLLENSGHELEYLDLVSKDPSVMDSATLSFAINSLVRLSGPLMEKLVESLNQDDLPDLKEIIETKGIDLDKKHASKLKKIIFAFRDSSDEETRGNFVKALQILTIVRQRRRVTLNLGESYRAPDEGWLDEDFGGDEGILETVKAVEDPRWNQQED